MKNIIDNSQSDILTFFDCGKTFVKYNLGRIAIKPEIEELNNYENLGVHHHLGGKRMGKNKKNH